jgi:hypothetical protein
MLYECCNAGGFCLFWPRKSCTQSGLLQALSACPPFTKFLYRMVALNARLLSTDAVRYSIDHVADESGATLVFQLAHVLSCERARCRFA